MSFDVVVVKLGSIEFDEREIGAVCQKWHIVKLGIPYEEVARVPQKYVVSIEINDGTFNCPWSLHEDTINHRRLCGEGEFDVKGFVSVMRKAGYSGAWGIEVLSEELRKKPLAELTTRSFSTTMSQFTD